MGLALVETGASLLPIAGRCEPPEQDRQGQLHVHVRCRGSIDCSLSSYLCSNVRPLIQFASIIACIMTTYIPSLTLPSFVFDNAAVSILIPVVAGATIGYSTRREFSSGSRHWP